MNQAQQSSSPEFSAALAREQLQDSATDPWDSISASVCSQLLLCLGINLFQNPFSFSCCSNTHHVWAGYKQCPTYSHPHVFLFKLLLRGGKIKKRKEKKKVKLLIEEICISQGEPQRCLTTARQQRSRHRQVLNQGKKAEHNASNLLS